LQLCTDPIRIAKQIVAEKFALKEKFGVSDNGNGKDMLDSFIEKGLTVEEAEAESLLQMWDFYLPTCAATNRLQHGWFRFHCDHPTHYSILSHEQSAGLA
jgi:hypothetical protein